jgi:hypothetical protein
MLPLFCPFHDLVVLQVLAVSLRTIRALADCNQLVERLAVNLDTQLVKVVAEIILPVWLQTARERDVLRTPVKLLQVGPIALAVNNNTVSRCFRPFYLASDLNSRLGDDLLMILLVLLNFFKQAIHRISLPTT